jgi:hypothetical protein
VVYLLNGVDDLVLYPARRQTTSWGYPGRRIVFVGTLGLDFDAVAATARRLPPIVLTALRAGGWERLPANVH